MDTPSESSAEVRPGTQFASDNAAGICPEAMAALSRANQDFAIGYGEDVYTRRASDMLRELFEIDCEVFFCFNGTAANAMALTHLCHCYHGIICHEQAHIETDECGAPEFFGHGSKILLAGGAGGRLDPESVREVVERRCDIHYPKPRVLSITQSTEQGTVYSLEALDGLCEQARRSGLRIHMDGARFANAVASLGVAPKELTWKRGVDVLCFGGTKNGLAVGEAVVFFDRGLAREFEYRCKQAGQLASKMRFITAPWVGILSDGAWRRHAAHANRCARELADRLTAIGGGVATAQVGIEPQVRLRHPVEANAVFVDLPRGWSDALHDRGWHFYTFIGEGGARLMCSWATRQADIDALVGDVESLASAERSVPTAGRPD